MMRPFFLALIGLLICTTMAHAGSKPPPSSSEVYFNLTLEDWVKTKSAKVMVGIDASAAQDALVQIRGELMATLNRMAAVKWHFTQFNQSKDQSGLGRIQAMAEARVPEQLLTGLHGSAKKYSRPGSNYRVVAIDFTPSLGEIEAMKTQMRKTIYTQVKKELQSLNEIYPTQQFVIKSIQFQSPVQRFAVAALDRPQAATNLRQQKAELAAVSVSQKLVLPVLVVAQSQIPKTEKSDS